MDKKLMNMWGKYTTTTATTATTATTTTATVTPFPAALFPSTTNCEQISLDLFCARMLLYTKPWLALPQQLNALWMQAGLCIVGKHCDNNNNKIIKYNDIKIS